MTKAAINNPTFLSVSAPLRSFRQRPRGDRITGAMQKAFYIGMKYTADITAGSLKLAESRIIADLLLKGVSPAELNTQIVQKNVLQTRNPATAVRVARLVRSRLQLMRPDLWRLIRDGSGNVATHAVFAAAVKQSALLADFLDLVVREQYRIFATTLPKRLWEEYLQDCRGRDPEMPMWNETTRRKCGAVVYHILTQAGYLENPRTTKLLAVHVAEPVINYLKSNGEDHVLRCMEVSS